MNKFIQKLCELVKELGCEGEVPARPPMTVSAKRLSLEEIARLQVLMGSKKLLMTLELGADPNATVKGISLRELAVSLQHLDLVKFLDIYGAKP